MSRLDGPSSELWNDLRSSAPAAGGQYSALEIRLEGKGTGTFMAVGRDHSLHVFIPATTGGDQPCPETTLNGLRITERQVDLPGSSGMVLDLASEPSFELMFSRVAREILEAVAVGHEEPRRAAEHVVRRWRAFWRPPVPEGLGRSAQVGLFGELWFLSRILLPKVGPEAVHRWTGSAGERHDFQWPRGHFEVKVTERNEPVFRIAGLDQLDSTSDVLLFLVGIRVREESSGDTGLTVVVDECEKALAAHPAELIAFRERLADTGYRMEAEEEYARLRLRLRAADLFEVSGDFPRLTAAAVAGGVPLGVTRVAYDIDLASRRPLAPSALDDMLRRSSGQDV